MATRDDGGPAFPVAVTDDDGAFVGHGAPGMSLHDWFAGQALPLIGTLVGLKALNEVAASRGMQVGAVAAIMAYDVADAMMAERSKR